MPVAEATPSFFELYLAERLHRAMGGTIGQVLGAISGRVTSGQNPGRVRQIACSAVNTAHAHLDETELLFWGFFQVNSDPTWRGAFALLHRSRFLF